MGTKLIVCDCLGSQTVDADRIAEASGLDVSRVFTNLCGAEAETAANLLSEGEVIVACQQESAFFEMLAEEIGTDAPGFVDIRDRAGWTDDANSAAPKMAALAAEAQLNVPAPKVLDVVSEGTCLLVGAGDAVFEAAVTLADTLAVTVLQTDRDDVPADRRFDVIRGNVRNLSGALGGFKVRIDQFAMLQPGGRGAFTFSAPKDGATSDCDIVIDLTGDTAMVPAPQKREGYFRADPRQPAAVAMVLAEAMQMIGTFEKPLYIALEPAICAHSRAEQAGCSKCLNICPTGAITSAGDHVAIDPMICAGCGACSAVCPSGAISYDAPPVDLTVRRVQTMAKAYLDAGGTAPRLLVHDTHVAEMIRLSARHGRGLPADVVPLEMSAIGAFGHAEALAALAAGFASLTLMPGPKADKDALQAQIALTAAIAGDTSIALLDTSDPDGMSDALFGETPPAPVAQPIRPMGTRRQITRQAARALHPDTAQLPLPDGAPYGAVLVDTGACTLCLSCVSLCPSGALGDNEDKPQLRFQEDACLQCGLCANICPENAITLAPRLDLTDAALRQEVLNEEEPFPCIECGALFGSKSAIDRITEKLREHAMFTGDKLRTIQMCDNCRVNAQFHATDNPFQGGEKPRVRTTEDYLSKRRDH